MTLLRIVTSGKQSAIAKKGKVIYPISSVDASKKMRMTDMKKKEQHQEFEPLLNFEDLAKATKLTVPFLRKAKRKYGLPYFKMGGSIKFRLSDVNTWIVKRKVVE